MCEPAIDRFTTPRGKQVKREICDQLVGSGLLRVMDEDDGGMHPAPGCYDLEKFFNRLFAMNLSTQNRLIDMFQDTYKYFIRKKELGDVSCGVVGRL